MTGLTCASDTPWLDHFAGGAGCSRCRAAADAACAEFDRLVAAGVYDAEGYTPKERQRQSAARAKASAAFGEPGARPRKRGTRMKAKVGQLALFVLLLSSSTVYAQTHPCDSTPPTSGTAVAGAPVTVQFCHDGKDSTGTVTITPTSFRLYVDNVGAPITMTKGTTSTVSGKSVYTGTTTAPVVGTHPMQVTALVGTAESLKSATFTLATTAAVPSAPTVLTVQ